MRLDPFFKTVTELLSSDGLSVSASNVNGRVVVPERRYKGKYYFEVLCNAVPVSLNSRFENLNPV